MSNYLELVQQLHTETGAAGRKPTTLVGISGEAERLAGWIKRADTDIQKLWVNWKFLWRTWTSLNVTTASINSLLKPADLSMWDFETFKIILPNQTQQDPLEVCEYDRVKSQILDTSEGVPYRAIVMPDKNLRFEPIPNNMYTIVADYYAKPIPLENNEDISAIPEDYHQVILALAMIFYGNYENAPEIKDQGSEEYTSQMSRLENDQLPNQENARYNLSGGYFAVSAE